MSGGSSPNFGQASARTSSWVVARETSAERRRQDVDLLSIRAGELTEALRAELAHRFGIAVPVRRLEGGRGYRVYQVQKPKNRDALSAAFAVQGASWL
jgi:hypothetical protein